jgi:uncharacterized protein (TIGR03382 family)
MPRYRGRPIGSPGRLAALLAAVALVPQARADGAFPDEFSIHFPASAPHRIQVGANFGLLVSEDDGATWRYACEPWVTEGSSSSLTQDNVSFYHLTADDSMIALSREITRSEDDACTWPPSGGVIVGKPVADFFPDPTDPTLVLAVVIDVSGYYIVASHDGGKTFVDPAIYTSTGLITGVELARSTPGVIYVTSISSSGNVATLARSDDHGAHWTPHPMTVPAGTEPLIMGIDPEDANTVYLRVSNGGLYDSLVITTDGGQTFDTSLVVSGQFSAFLRATDGSLYLGELAGKLHVRAPGATTFTSGPGPHFRCLGQRSGTSRVFACGDMGLDGFSVGYSDDSGQTFHRMMSFVDLLGPLTCSPVATACVDHWQRIQGVLGIGPAPDGGTGPGPDAGTGTPDAGTVPPPPPSGQPKSGCSTSGGDTLAILAFIVAIALLLQSRRWSS